MWDPVFDCVAHELDDNNAVKAEYHNEPQQYGGVLSQRRGTTSHYHHHDALGSTRFLTDSSGNVTDTYLHDAWGNSIASTGTTVNPFKWVGKYGYYTDNSTAQVFVRARMYQPTVARWVSVDPKRFKAGLNFYLYSFLDPVTTTDPSGLSPLPNEVIEHILEALKELLGPGPGVGKPFTIPNFLHTACCSYQRSCYDDGIINDGPIFFEQTKQRVLCQIPWADMKKWPPNLRKIKLLAELRKCCSKTLPPETAPSSCKCKDWTVVDVVNARCNSGEYDSSRCYDEVFKLYDEMDDVLNTGRLEPEVLRFGSCLDACKCILKESGAEVLVGLCSDPKTGFCSLLVDELKSILSKR